jgi:hypothetical protein
MASEKEIGANRRNAGKSTGPRSASGKRRASWNAYRHGLSKPMFGAEFASGIEALARRLAGSATDPMTLALARDTAEAVLELARVRRVKVAPIERAHRFGRVDAPKIFKSPKDEAAWITQHYFGATAVEGRPKFAVETRRCPYGSLSARPRPCGASFPICCAYVATSPVRLPAETARSEVSRKAV